MCSRSGRKFVPPGLRRTRGCCLITSGCPPAPAPAARVCLPDFLRGQCLTFELPGSRDILSDDLRRHSQRSSARRRTSRSHMLREKLRLFTPGNLSLARQPIKCQPFKAVFISWIFIGLWHLILTFYAFFLQPFLEVIEMCICTRICICIFFQYLYSFYDDCCWHYSKASSLFVSLSRANNEMIFGCKRLRRNDCNTKYCPADGGTRTANWRTI